MTACAAVGPLDPKRRQLIVATSAAGAAAGIGICTYLGCSPTEKFKHGAAQGMQPDWPGGFFCPCHGSQFDLAGRVFKNMPAPTNLEIPPHQYLAEGRLLIGEDTQAA